MKKLDELATACRVLAAEGHDDFTMGHLSIRADVESFWLKRAFIALSEVRGPDDFLRVSFAGEVLDGDGSLHREWPIHAEILRRRDDVAVVGHTHPRWATRLSATTRPLRPIANYAVPFAAGLPRFDVTSDLIDTPALGVALAETLGGGRAALLRNHGIVFCGPTIGNAAVTAVYLERAAEDFLTMKAADVPLDLPAREELDAKAMRTAAPEAFERFWHSLCAAHREGSP